MNVCATTAISTTMIDCSEASREISFTKCSQGQESLIAEPPSTPWGGG